MLTDKQRGENGGIKWTIKCSTGKVMSCLAPNRQKLIISVGNPFAWNSAFCWKLETFATSWCWLWQERLLRNVCFTLFNLPLCLISTQIPCLYQAQTKSKCLSLFSLNSTKWMAGAWILLCVQISLFLNECNTTMKEMKSDKNINEDRRKNNRSRVVVSRSWLLVVLFGDLKICPNSMQIEPEILKHSANELAPTVWAAHFLRCYRTNGTATHFRYRLASSQWAS